MRDFDHIDTWIFDLDNTLYPPDADLFAQIELRMTDWVMRELRVDRDRADHMRRDYWDRYGTTLAGLMAEHDVDPGPYLTDVHDIAFTSLVRDDILADRLRALPGRRIVFTNGTAPYARKVLDARGLGDAFDAIYGVEHAGFRPKPERAAFDAILTRDGSRAASAAMFEDVSRNLVVPHDLGMRTVHVAPLREAAGHIDHHTTDLSDFLSRLG